MMSETYNATELANRSYTTIILRERTTTGGYVYVARHPDLPYCTAQGMTLAEARDNLDEVRQDYFEYLLEENLPLPPIVSETNHADKAEPIFNLYRSVAPEIKGEVVVLAPSLEPAM
jgi:predicted RNase H-like HicB family nuclease